MDEANKKFVLAGKEYHEGDWLSIDGSTGCIYDGVIPTVDATIAGEFGRIMGCLLYTSSERARSCLSGLHRCVNDRIPKEEEELYGKCKF